MTMIRTAAALADLFVEALNWQDPIAWDAIEEGVSSAQSFRDAGLLTTDHGVVLRLANGAEFALTIAPRTAPDAGPEDDASTCRVVEIRPGEWAVKDEHENRLIGPFYHPALAEAECRQREANR